MARKVKVFQHGTAAGILEETDEASYRFTYDRAYLANEPPAPPVSLTLPLRPEPYESKVLFSFFDGLIPEGWLLNLAVKNWKLNQKDRMGLLIEACGDCIGSVHIEKAEV